MNIALPAVVVFLLLLPGFIARSRIKYVERQLLDYSPFGTVVATAVVWAGALHALWLAFARLLAGKTPDVAALLGLVSSDAATQRAAMHALVASIQPVTLYFSSLLLCAYILPAMIRTLVVRLRLDRGSSRASWLFRFNDAPWYYLLTGADFAAGQEPDLIAVSALVNVAGRPMLYTGTLDEFFLDQEGRLERMILQQVMRRPLEADKAGNDGNPSESRFYPVDGDYFVLRYAETITLNVQYIRLSPAATGAESALAAN
ncbi:MAG: hypothetical protein QM581_03435 [Pseudomonas sp.]